MEPWHELQAYIREDGSNLVLVGYAGQLLARRLVFADRSREVAVEELWQYAEARGLTIEEE